MNEIISYIELLSAKGDSYISYSELLNTFEWQEKRNEIIKRDGNKCMICYSRPNEKAWWISAPFEVYVRYPDVTELEFMADDIIHEDELCVMHVHHKYYINKHLPWEYKNDTFITICAKCHKEIHLNSAIYVYEDTFLKDKTLLIPCEKCSGTGYLSEFHYHMQGICFKCNGNRFT